MLIPFLKKTCFLFLKQKDSIGKGTEFSILETWRREQHKQIPMCTSKCQTSAEWQWFRDSQFRWLTESLVNRVWGNTKEGMLYRRKGTESQQTVVDGLKNTEHLRKCQNKCIAHRLNTEPKNNVQCSEFQNNGSGAEFDRLNECGNLFSFLFFRSKKCSQHLKNIYQNKKKRGFLLK